MSLKTVECIEVAACNECPFNDVQIGYDENTCGLYYKLEGASSPYAEDGTVPGGCPLKGRQFSVTLSEQP